MMIMMLMIIITLARAIFATVMIGIIIQIIKLSIDGKLQYYSFDDDRDDKDDGSNSDDDVDVKGANFHGPTVTNNNKLTLHKQLIK